MVIWRTHGAAAWYWRIEVEVAILLSGKVGKTLDFYFLLGHCLADTL